MRVMFLSVMFIVHFNSVQREGVILKKKKKYTHFLAAYPGTLVSSFYSFLIHYHLFNAAQQKGN